MNWLIDWVKRLIAERNRRREWSAERQLHELRVIVMMDNRWLAHDKTADALTGRYLKLLNEHWYHQSVEDVRLLRERLGLDPMRNVEVCDTYGVINEDGEVEYSAYWPEACHDHIKDMQIEHGMGSKWKVRALKYLPVTTPRKEST